MREPDPGDVEALFGRLAPAYDRFNRLSSFGLDQGWRRRCALAVRPGDRVLDLGCGTGDLSLLAAALTPAVHGVDLAEPMLGIARVKAARTGVSATFTRASAAALPFPEGSFDCLLSGFVLRSLAAVRGAVGAEVARVLAPGGRASLLELTRPRNPALALGHRLWLALGIPVVGRLAAGRRWPGAYLTDTILSFPEPEDYAAWFTSNGLVVERIDRLAGGIACLLMLRKP